MACGSQLWTPQAASNLDPSSVCTCQNLCTMHAFCAIFQIYDTYCPTDYNADNNEVGTWRAVSRKCQHERPDILHSHKYSCQRHRLMMCLWLSADVSITFHTVANDISFANYPPRRMMNIVLAWVICYKTTRWVSARTPQSGLISYDWNVLTRLVLECSLFRASLSMPASPSQSTMVSQQIRYYIWASPLWRPSHYWIRSLSR